MCRAAVAAAAAAVGKPGGLGLPGSAASVPRPGGLPMLHSMFMPSLRQEPDLLSSFNASRPVACAARARLRPIRPRLG